MIFDMHTHTFPDSIAGKAVAKLADASHSHPYLDGTVGSLRLSMAEAGVDGCMVQPVATSARQVAHINDSAIETESHAAETGVHSFGAMHPDDPDWKAELRRVAAAGLRGIKLHPPYQNVDFDDLRYLRILDECGQLGLIVLIHAGLDVGLPGNTHAMPDMIRRAVDAVGPVTLIAAHMGGWKCWPQVCELLADTSVLLDTSYSLGPIAPNGDGYPWTPEERQRLTEQRFVDMVRLFGAERILFGSDSPWENQAAEVRRIRALPLTDAEKTAILGENAARVLGL